MKKVFCADNTVEAGLVNSVLEANGIACLVKNQNLGGALGEIPPLECWPEIWVTDDADYYRALRLVEEIRNQEHSTNDNWLCSCGETIEAQFNACWQCGREHPVSEVGGPA